MNHLSFEAIRHKIFEYVKDIGKIEFLKLMVLLVSFIALLFVSIFFLPGGTDLKNTFLPGAQAFLNGQSPYQYIYNPPWVLVPFIPLTLLPLNISRMIWFYISFILFIYTFRKLGANTVTVVILFLSPPVILSLYHGNIECLVIVGFILSPQLGLFFILLKPQIGLAVAMFWFVDILWHKGWREVLRVFAPVTIFFLLSFVFFGFWPFRINEMLVHARYENLSLFPYSVPVGMTLLVTAIRKRDIRYAMGASPCLSPYTLPYAWVGAFAALGKHRAELVMAVIGMWGLFLFAFLQ